MDLDEFGQVEFDEFLEIILKIKRGGSSYSTAMLNFFKRTEREMKD